MTPDDDLQPVPEDIPPAPNDDQQLEVERRPVRMCGPDRGRLTQAAVELMLRRID